MRQRISVIAIITLISFTISATVKLPALIGDNMVLQQQTDARLWGEATPSSLVTIRPSWTDQHFSVSTDKSGRWITSIPTPAASQADYTISFSDKDGDISISNVLIGEVWYCSGQSNMEMPVRGYKHQPVDGGLDLILSARETTPIRMFTVSKAFSATPLDTCNGQWKTNTPDAVADCSATAYFFADYLSKSLGDIPVGIIISSWGGTKVQPWLSPAAAKIGLHSENINESAPSALYNAMVAPLLDYTIKGLLWYQGESNCDDPELYERLMPEYVNCMREGFDLGDIPFYYVQIAPHDGYGDLSDNVAPLRLAQGRLMNQIPNCGMAVTLDIGNPYCIHPTDKRSVGKRLAYWALAKDYDKNVYAYSGPIFDRMEWDGKRALLYFTNTGGGVSPLEQPLAGFEAAAEDGVYHPARAIVECETGTLSVYCDSIGEIKSVRYGHSACPTATLFDNFGLPAAPFITK